MYINVLAIGLAFFAFIRSRKIHCLSSSRIYLEVYIQEMTTPLKYLGVSTGLVAHLNEICIGQTSVSFNTGLI